MKKIIIIFLSIYALVTTISCTVISTNNDCLMWRNRELNSMCEAVVAYSDSVADTGEMDDFIQSDLGQYFFETYNSIKPLPEGTKMLLSWPWCAASVSAWA